MPYALRCAGLLEVHMNWRKIRVLLVASVLAPCLALVAGAEPAVAVSPDVVVSQVYGGGGNAGATLQNDFIELHNRSAAPVSLDGLVGAVRLGHGLDLAGHAAHGQHRPRRHYLVQEAAGAGGTTPLPTPDATGSIAMSGDRRQGRAGRRPPPRSRAARAAPATPSVRDFVGYGATASSFEGAAPAPGLSNTTAALRADDGATDTDNNAADFAAGSPNPRNCGVRAAPAAPVGL